MRELSIAQAGFIGGGSEKMDVLKDYAKDGAQLGAVIVGLTTRSPSGIAAGALAGAAVGAGVAYVFHDAFRGDVTPCYSSESGADYH